MIAKESLMLGDWVRNDLNQVEKVFELRETQAMLSYNNLYDYDDLEPIPLTDDILKANGFRREGGASYWHEGGRDAAVIYWSKDNTELIIGCPSDDCFTKKPVRYVHELQHAFVEAGIDKEIILDDCG